MDCNKLINNENTFYLNITSFHQGYYWKVCCYYNTFIENTSQRLLEVPYEHGEYPPMQYLDNKDFFAKIAASLISFLFLWQEMSKSDKLLKIKESITI